MKKDYILPNFKLQFSHNIFPRACVGMSEQWRNKSPHSPHNIRMSFFFVFVLFLLLFLFVLFLFLFVCLFGFLEVCIYLQIEINHRKHNYTTTLDFTNLLVKLWNRCSWKI